MGNLISYPEREPASLWWLEHLPLKEHMEWRTVRENPQVIARTVRKWLCLIPFVRSNAPLFHGVPKRHGWVICIP